MYGTNTLLQYIRNRKPIDVLFFVEHVDRELQVAQELARRLQRQGRSVVILQSRLHIPLVGLISTYKVPIQVCIYPSVVNLKESVLYQALSPVPSHVDLHWEQLLYAPGKLTKRPRGDALDSKFYHIAWDAGFKDYLTSNGVQESQVVVTGNPAMAVLYHMAKDREHYRQKFALDFSLDSERLWIFLPMNYSWAFFSEKDLQYRRKLGYPEQVLAEFPKYAQKCFRKFVVFVQELAQQEAYQIIIRPHPGVTQEQYVERFYEITRRAELPSNVRITHSRSAREWLVASDIVGSSWSTVAYDAYRLGKPAFLFTPYPRPEWLEVDWYKKLVEVRDFRDFQEKWGEMRHRAPAEEVAFHREALERLENFLLGLTAEAQYGVPKSLASMSFQLKKMWGRRIIVALMMRMMVPRRIHRILFPKWRLMERDYMTPQIFLPEISGESVGKDLKN